MIPNHFVFREYDIRGIADRDLPDDFCYQLGLALGHFWGRKGAKTVAVGRDCRLSSPRIRGALVRGIVETGLDVVDVGMVPTPLLYFSVFHLDGDLAVQGGVMITGSHNPADENGFKMMTGKATLTGEEIQELKGHILGGHAVRSTRPGTVIEHDIVPAYAGFMRGNISLGDRKPRFAIDGGNGAGGPATMAALRALGLHPTTLLMEPDGHFPVHHPDPSQMSNLQLLIDTVRKEGLEFGIAFDGDADRIGVVDDEGNVIWGDRLMILFARDILKRHHGAPIIGEVKCSEVLYQDIAKHGGRPILWKTGHSLIKKKMKEEGALLAGEMSGHMFFADRYFGFDDAIYAAMRLVELASKTDLTVAEGLADLPVTFSTPELRVEATDQSKFKIVDYVKQHFQKEYKVNDVDGARIQFESGWGLVRASNTQPILVLRFEADTAAHLTAIQNEVEAVVRQANLSMS